MTAHAALKAAGWLPLRIREHDDPRKAASRIERAVRRRLPFAEK
jgi:hypothetical protein